MSRKAMVISLIATVALASACLAQDIYTVEVEMIDTPTETWLVCPGGDGDDIHVRARLLRNGLPMLMDVGGGGGQRSVVSAVCEVAEEDGISPCGGDFEVYDYHHTSMEWYHFIFKFAGGIDIDVAGTAVIQVTIVHSPNPPAPSVVTGGILADLRSTDLDAEYENGVLDVGLADLTIFTGGYYSTEYVQKCDLDGSGDVDVADLQIFTAHYFNSECQCGGSASKAVSADELEQFNKLFMAEEGKTLGEIRAIFE